MDTLLKRMVVALLMCVLSPYAFAEDCNTDCHKQCRIRTDFPPISFIEPTCHAKCEIAKKAACIAGRPVPNVPLTLREQTELYGTQACAGPFQAITNYVIAQCSNWDGRLDNQHLIGSAIGALKSIGAITDSDLQGVQVRWCPLPNGHGMAPDRGRIYLDTGLQGDPLATASTLAHEVIHIRQYRRNGTDRFKCDYSRAFAECGGCQDRRNAFEREAYDYEAQIQSRLAQGFRGAPLPGAPPPMPMTGIPVRFCRTPAFTCEIGPAMVPMGTSCWCNLPNGQRANGQAF